MSVIRHRNITVQGLDIFVREAGDPARPTIVLLPGFPSSTRAYVRLIDRLRSAWHVVAIDYPGFGGSQPLPESPTFDRLAEVTGQAIDHLVAGDYALYLFDFGAPVGFRIAIEHDARVRAVISQNGNAYTDGLGPAVSVLARWWSNRDAEEEAITGMLGIDGTRMQWTAGSRDPQAVNPDHALADQAVLDLPGRKDYMRALLWDYQTNPAAYPQWQAWLRRRQPEVLAVWGRHDPFFVPTGAQAFTRDVPTAHVALLETGHFALEEEVDTIADLTAATLRVAFLAPADDTGGGDRTQHAETAA